MSGWQEVLDQLESLPEQFTSSRCSLASMMRSAYEIGKTDGFKEGVEFLDKALTKAAAESREVPS